MKYLHFSHSGLKQFGYMFWYRDIADYQTDMVMKINTKKLTLNNII